MPAGSCSSPGGGGDGAVDSLIVIAEENAVESEGYSCEKNDACSSPKKCRFWKRPCRFQPEKLVLRFVSCIDRILCNVAVKGSENSIVHTAQCQTCWFDYPLRACATSH